MDRKKLEELAALCAGRQQERFGVYARIAAELRAAGAEPPAWQGRIPQVEERARMSGCEVRALPEGVLEGVAIVWDAESDDLGGFTETVRRGATTKTLRESDVLALWHHHTDQVLGRLSAGTLSLTESKRGLEFSVDLPETQLGRDAWESVNRGDVVGSSFGFRTIVDRWTEKEGQPAFRELLEIALVDVSPVSLPAYPQTSVDARAYEAVERHRLTCRDASCRHSSVRPRDPAPEPPTRYPGALSHRRARLALLSI